MIQEKLNELKEYIECNFKEKYVNIIIEDNTLKCLFSEELYVIQFNREVKEEYSKYNFDFKIVDNNIIVKYFK